MLRKMFAVVVSMLLGIDVGQKALAEATSAAPTTFFVFVDVSGSMDDRFPAPVQPQLTDATKLQDVRRRLGLLAGHMPTGTRIVVTTFDHQPMQQCDITLSTEAEREQLRKVFESIRGRNGSTYLWRTLDRGLSEAKDIVTAKPGSRVRVLLYSDGNDEERAPGLDHQSIIRKYGRWLQSTIRVDWSCIGFDISQQMHRELSQAGFTINKADTPADLDPLIAVLKLSASKLLVGEELIVEDQSIGNAIVERRIDWGDGSPHENLSPQHKYGAPGTYVIRYKIKSSEGRTDHCSQTVTVIAPPPVETKIEIQKSTIQAGERILARDGSSTTAVEVRWFVDGTPVSDQATLDYLSDSPGKHTIRLERRDAFGRSSADEALVSVVTPPVPQVSFRPAGSIAGIRQPIVLINESGATAERFEWRANGELVSTDRHAEWTPKNYGRHAIQLTIWDRWQQSQTAERLIDIPRPPKPVAKLSAPDVVKPREEVQCFNLTTGETIAEARWTLDGVPVGTGNQISLTAPSSGRHILALSVKGPGGTDSIDHELTVQEYLPPIAAFTIGSESPFVGDVIRVTDVSSGEIERVTFRIHGLEEQAISREFEVGSGVRWFDLTCSKCGEVRIEMSAYGPGGQSECKSSFFVKSRAIQPRADFELTQLRADGRTVATFLSRTIGSVTAYELDPGDGSAVRRFDPSQQIQYQYGPGQWVPKIKALADGPNLAPSVWVGPAIEVDPARPQWIRDLVWQVPSALGLGAGALFMAWGIRARRRRWQQRLLTGELIVYPLGKPLNAQYFSFEGKSFAEVVPLDAKSSLRLACSADEMEPYQVELLDEGVAVAGGPLDANGAATIGGYVVSYDG